MNVVVDSTLESHCAVLELVVAGKGDHCTNVYVASWDIGLDADLLNALRAVVSGQGCFATTGVPHPVRVRRMAAVVTLDVPSVVRTEVDAAESGEWCCMLFENARRFLAE